MIASSEELDLTRSAPHQSLLKRAQEALQEEALSHEKARALVEEIKLEAALFSDSPYLEVGYFTGLSVPAFRLTLVGKGSRGGRPHGRCDHASEHVSLVAFKSSAQNEKRELITTLNDDAQLSRLVPRQVLSVELDGPR